MREIEWDSFISKSNKPYGACVQTQYLQIYTMKQTYTWLLIMKGACIPFDKQCQRPNETVTSSIVAHQGEYINKDYHALRKRSALSSDFWFFYNMFEVKTKHM